MAAATKKPKVSLNTWGGAGRFTKPAVAAAKPPTTPPGTVGLPPTVQPFMGANEYAAMSQHIYGNSMTQADSTKQLADTAAQVSYGKNEANRSARQNSSAANDNAGARGIFGSSINQGDLTDIEGTRQRAQDNLDAQLGAAQLHHNSVMAAITDLTPGSAEWNFFQGINQGMVDNAKEVNDQVGPPESTAAPAAAPGKPAATPAARPAGPKWAGKNVFQQTEGDRAGQWYHVVKQGGKTFRMYQNGERIPIG